MNSKKSIEFAGKELANPFKNKEFQELRVFFLSKNSV